MFGQSVGSTETVTREVPAPAETVTETATETVTETATETVTETMTEPEAAEADNGALDSAEARIEELEGENADLEQQVAAAAAPSAVPAPAAPAPAAPAPAPAAPAASTVTEGVYIVGEDVQPGTYRTANPNGTFCSMWQYPDLSRDVSNVLEYVQGEGPMILPVQTVGSVVEVSGTMRVDRVVSRPSGNLMVTGLR